MALGLSVRVSLVPYVVGDTCGSGIVSNVADVIGMRGVGRPCKMCICLCRDCVRGEEVSGKED